MTETHPRPKRNVGGPAGSWAGRPKEGPMKPRRRQCRKRGRGQTALAESEAGQPMEGPKMREPRRRHSLQRG